MTPIFLTLKLATVTTVILLILGIPLAWWLANSKFRLKALIEVLVSLPLVLPPTVIGFYLLVAFSPNSGLGEFLDETFGIQLLFNFSGLVLGSIIYSLPFMISPIQAAFEALPQQLKEAASNLGKSKWEIFRFVELPNIRRSILSGIVLCFAHTLGEFGLVLMIGGNISGETRVASIEIFDLEERLQYSAANFYALILLGISFGILLLLYFTKQRGTKRF